MREFLSFSAIALAMFVSLPAIGLYLKRQSRQPSEGDTTETIALSPISLPGNFPAGHAGHILQATQPETPAKGVKTHRAAIYWSASDVESEVSVRLLELEGSTAEAWRDAFFGEILKSARELAVPAPVPDTGWKAARLFERDGAGIFVAWTDSTLLVVCAGAPPLAGGFGRALALDE